MSMEMDRIRQRVNDELITREDASLPQFPAAWSPPTGFFTFRYTSTEIFSQGDQLHVKMRETRYEDGRLKSEECEGTLDQQAYQQMVNEAQGYFLNQMAGVARLLLAPFMRGRW